MPNKESGSKTVEIFPIIDQKCSEAPITICCGKEARVKDVIGLACLKYCAEARPQRPEPPVSGYELFMCEEDGTLDSDFPALDSNVGGPPFKFLNHSLIFCSGAIPEVWIYTTCFSE